MQNLSDEIKMKRAMELASSPEGQKLMAMLQKNGGPEMQLAMEKAAAGDYAAAKQALATVMASAEIRRLIENMGR